jgi:serine/threonine protein kinase
VGGRRITTSRRWRRIDALFEACADAGPEERAARLAEAEPALRAAVEELLVAHAQADTPLDAPLTLPGPADDEQELVGGTLGAYRVLARLGRGGMGDVYLAERSDGGGAGPVALKLVRAGLDVAPIRRRFASERNILAGLEHVHIARLLDAGESEDGRPFFVVEYVDGTPIDEYCRGAALALGPRLQLFRQVCAAVDYAHRRGVVHRDLKPGNILVTRDGVPKLIDFGIAKLRERRRRSAAGRASTVTALGVMTPDYASPEQVLGAPVAPRSDVYSLGAVLYELLTGRPPRRLDGLTPQQVVRALVQEAPAAPSAAASAADALAPAPIDAAQLRGDLDAVVLKALRRAPEERYASASQLADDLGRYLAGLPLRGGSRWRTWLGLAARRSHRS